ncbi:MAG: patatin-like phospholipase family protein [Brevinematia bacterium]
MFRFGHSKVGVALGSGSFKGVCHLGFIKALEEKGVYPDVITGSSVGAIIGALWASGLNSQKIIDIFKQINSRNFLRYISFSASRKGFIDAKIEEFLNEHIGQIKFDELKTKLIVLATDITNGVRVAISEGSVSYAVRKSIAVPGIIKPVIENDDIIIDGGVLAPVPIKELYEEKCDKIFVSSLIPLDHRKLLPTSFERISKSARQKLEEIFKIDLPDPSLTIYSIIKRSLILMNIQIEDYEIMLYKPIMVVRYPIDDLDLSALDNIDYYINLGYEKTKELLSSKSF